MKKLIANRIINYSFYFYFNILKQKMKNAKIDRTLFHKSSFTIKYFTPFCQDGVFAFLPKIELHTQIFQLIKMTWHLLVTN